MKKISFIILLMAMLLAITKVAVAQSVLTSVDAEAEGVKEFFGTTDIEQGNKIAIKTTVGVYQSSSYPLDGFWIRLVITKPGGTEYDQWYDKTSTVINPGEQRTITCYTGITADELGYWVAVAYLYTKDKQVELAQSEEISFKVVEKTPSAWITISEVFGYTTASSILILGWYAIRSIFAR
jgi:hypothetical protein